MEETHKTTIELIHELKVHKEVHSIRNQKKQKESTKPQSSQKPKTGQQRLWESDSNRPPKNPHQDDCIIS